MEKSTRLSYAFDLKQADRPPILGGWLAAPESIQQLTGCTADQYWEDPFGWGLEAEQRLGSDGIVGIFEPVSRDSYRCVDERVMQTRADYTVESVLAEIEALPEPRELEQSFDEDAAFGALAAEMRENQARCGDLVWCPADWKLVPHGLWYHEYGYETSMLTLGLHPDRYRKLIEVSAVEARQRATVRARAIREGISPNAVLAGEDLCSQEGPMVSPDFLRKEYFPLLEYAIEPLVEVGARLVWHCDGAYGKLINDVLACGVGGLQGFQKECGMDLEWIVDRRTRDGDPLLIFGPMSVTTTLPFGTPDDIRKDVAWAMDTCRDRASLVFFTSNTITPDVPVENIVAFWEAVRDSRW
jgi:hypothetical protein